MVLRPNYGAVFALWETSYEVPGGMCLGSLLPNGCGSEIDTLDRLLVSGRWLGHFLQPLECSNRKERTDHSPLVLLSVRG